MTTNDPGAGFGPAPEPTSTFGPVPHGAVTPGYPGLPPYGAVWAPPAPQPAAPSLARRALIGVGGAALAVGLVVAGVGIGNATTGSATASGTSITGPSGSSGTSGTSGTSGGAGTGGGTGAAGLGNSGTTSASVATPTQQKGIVTVVSVLGYQNAESAGTGMILSSDGEILTNNHVIDGATRVTVTVESTGRSYLADVVGTAPTKDVAVLQLRGASGLTTASVGDASDVAGLTTGDAVTAVGNANGTGTLTVAAGTVTDLEQTITASDESGQNTETLSGLIETNAGIVAGDSGGPLYDADGAIVGMNTAGSSGAGATRAAAGATSAAATQAYAIPIDDALSLAAQIESGVRTSTVHIGLPAFLGIGVSDSASGGAAITSVVTGGPADGAGITAGSTITAVGGTSVTDPATLASALGGHRPGESVSVTWVDPGGASRTGTVTLASGPAD